MWNMADARIGCRCLARGDVRESVGKEPACVGVFDEQSIHDPRSICTIRKVRFSLVN
jgi:hypothetical protein